tara:strand:- start:11 stop:136 length:126 start_codon:yes stop_codon:yes gene_type:complete
MREEILDALDPDTSIDLEELELIVEWDVRECADPRHEKEAE